MQKPMKNLITSLFLFLISFSLSSQDIGFSARGGVVYNKLQVTNSEFGMDESTDWGQGYKVGFFLNTVSGEVFDLETGLEFAIYGLKNNSNQAHASYLQAPVLGILNISDNTKFIAGPSLGYRVNDQNLERIKIDAIGAIEFDLWKTTLRFGASYSINNIAPWEIIDFTTREVVGEMTGRLLEISVGFVYRAR